MIAQTGRLDSELRLSPKPVLLLLAALSFGLLLAAESLLDEAQLARLLYLDIAIVIFCVSTWFIHDARPMLGRLLTFTLIEAAILSGDVGLRMPGFLALLPIVPALAIVMVGPSCGLTLAALETALLIGLQRYSVGPPSDPATPHLGAWPKTPPSAHWWEIGPLPGPFSAPDGTARPSRSRFWVQSGSPSWHVFSEATFRLGF